MNPIDAPDLDCFEGFPDHLLDVPAEELWRHLRGPSLFHVPGRQERPLFVSVLLHGNEDTGWRAAQAVLRQHRGAMLPRALLLFIGNIEAARAKVRRLPHQDDYNRTWPGTPDPDTAASRLMHKVVDIICREAPSASIDIHNNSGHNPHYACVSSIERTHLYLARLFSRTVVYIALPLGIQCAALAKLCPAVTIECGRIGETAAVPHVAEFIGAALALQRFPDRPPPESDIDLLRIEAIMRVPPDASISFDGSEADFRFRSDLDRLNFSELQSGTLLGFVGAGRRLDVQSVDGLGASDPFLRYEGGEIRLGREAVPAMLTLDPAAIRLDCLGYLMGRMAPRLDRA